MVNLSSVILIGLTAVTSSIAVMAFLKNRKKDTTATTQSSTLSKFTES